jgi:hypothetical protein
MRLHSKRPCLTTYDKGTKTPLAVAMELETNAYMESSFENVI